MVWTLPNILTCARLLAAPGLALCYLAAPRPQADWIAFALFVAAAATDWIDGYLARRNDQVTGFGAMLDPIADKAIVVIALALLLALAGPTPALLVPVVVILFREVAVSGLREYLGAVRDRLAVTRLAKWKTTAQMAAIAVVFVALGLDPAALAGAPDSGATCTLPTPGADWAGFGRCTGLAGAGLLWLAALLTLLTGADYFRKALPLIEETRT